MAQRSIPALPKTCIRKMPSKAALLKRTRAQRIPFRPGDRYSNKGRIHSRRPILSSSLFACKTAADHKFLFRSFTDNPFLSQLVRIQSERGQHVIDTGVYGLVRHPMYLGADLMFVGGALLLGSAVGLLVGLGLVLLLVLRIFGEEKLLASDLEGYQGYRG